MEIPLRATSFSPSTQLVFQAWCPFLLLELLQSLQELLERKAEVRSDSCSGRWAALLLSSCPQKSQPQYLQGLQLRIIFTASPRHKQQQ